MDKDVEDTIAATRKLVGDEADLSYITRELIDEAVLNSQDAGLHGHEDGNTLTVTAGGITRWRPNCNPNPKSWKATKNKVTQKQLPTCTNGLLHYDITY